LPSNRSSGDGANQGIPSTADPCWPRVCDKGSDKRTGQYAGINDVDGNDYDDNSNGALS